MPDDVPGAGAMLEGGVEGAIGDVVDGGVVWSFCTAGGVVCALTAVAPRIPRAADKAMNLLLITLLL